MKYVKAFENFQVNEEISLRGLAPIITSLFLTFNSFDSSAFPSGGSSRSRYIYYRHVTNQIESISNKIERDLERLKSETQDPEFLRLIESVHSLDGWQYSDGMDQVNKVINDLRNYIQSQDINDSLINDTLNNLTSGDIKLIESDYKLLLQKYEEVLESEKVSRTLMIIVLTLVACFCIYVGFQYRGGLPG